MDFSPAIDRRLVRLLARTPDLSSAAATWRQLRRHAGKAGISTPCYESVRRMVHRERERRARIAAALATVVEIATRRIPVLPEDVPRIHARQLGRFLRRHPARDSSRRHLRGGKGTGPP